MLTPRGASQAASFTSGNVVVYRVGDGIGTLANTGNAVFVDEYMPGGTLVQSIPLPTTASGSNNQLIASGTAGSEGLLTRSTNGQYLLLTGYARKLGGSGSLSSTTATAVPRTVAIVKFDGSIDTSTALTDFATGNNPRSAASTNGLDIWVGGAAGGVRYTSYSKFGSSTSTQLSTDSTNIEQVNIFDGQLYVSTQKGTTIRVGSVGAATPTTTGQSITNLPGFPTTGNPDAFFFADLDGTPGVDTLYVADDTTGGGQIQKYSFVAGGWTPSGTITAASVHGLTGVVNGATVILYATGSGAAGTSGTLYTFTDTTGYGATVSGTADTLATAPANETFRGVALAPVSSLSPSPTPTATATPIPAATATKAPTPSSTATKTRTPTPTGAAASTTTPTHPPTNTPTHSTASTPKGTAFTPGNVVVYRVGDGTTALTDNGTAVFLDEYSASGSLVQSVALPTTASGSQNQLIATTDVSEGLLARSTDGQYVLLTGYASDLGGSTALATTAAAAVPRTVGRVKYDGTIDTSTGLTDMSSKNNVRSATSTDGTDIWVGGASGSSGGVHYTTLGSTTSTQLFSTIPKGVRQVNIFGGQLYFDSNATGLLNVSAVGVGTPTTGGQSGTELPGLSDVAGNDGYFFVDLGDGHGLATLYVANDSLGQILKYALVSGSWTASGTISAAGVHGVTGVVSGTDVTLYATGTTGTDGTLYSFTDTTGYDGTVSGTTTTLATPSANEAFRGVALAPVAIGAPTATNTPGGNAGNTPTRTLSVPTATPTPTPSPNNQPMVSPTPTPTLAPFTPGNVVVYRIGDGTTALSSGVGSPVFLDEYTSAGTLVRSVALPTTANGANQPLVGSGTAGTEGLLTRSADGQYLLLTGYDAALGTGSLTKSTATAVPRTVGRVDANGDIDTTTALTDFSSGDKPRSAASTNGMDLWLSSGSKATNPGVHYTTLGSTTSTVLSSTVTDSRQVNVFGGQLYVSTQDSSGLLLGTVGTGTPTTAGQTVTALAGFATTGKPEGFLMVALGGAGIDTLYVVDESAGIEKWSLVGGSWTMNNAIAPAADQLYGITGVVDGTSVTLYATGSTATNDAGTLYSLTDSSGFNGAMNGSLNPVATAAANETFRGVALAPVTLGAPTPSPSVTPIACIGDCDGSGMVTVDEILTLVNIALGSGSVMDCEAGDANQDGQITIDEILIAVNHALNGCASS
ncbi:MAG: hypothetical protein ACHQ4J_06240 [Candidatus Binatia bacterium]